VHVKGQHRAIAIDVHLDDDRLLCHRGSSPKGTEANTTGVPEADASTARRAQIERRRRLRKRKPKGSGRQGLYVWCQTQLICINVTGPPWWQASAVSGLQAAKG
jgi:hypothetical protein